LPLIILLPLEQFCIFINTSLFLISAGVDVFVQVTSQSMAEWGTRHAHLNEVGNFLIESTDPQTSRSVAEELRKLNVYWAEFVKRNTFVS